MSHAAGASTGRLRLALVATAAVAVLEAAGGWLSGSLALLSDAAHVAMDAVALAIALGAAIQAKRPATARQTYGFARYEILAALANGGLLSAVTALIVVEAVRRFMHPEVPHGGIMIIVAAIGLAVNISVGLMLARGHHHDLNLRAAVLHVAGDALGALAVIVGGAIITVTGAAWVDPLLSLLVAAIIVAGIFGVVREATGVLLESAPAHVDIDAVRGRMRGVEGVVEVHDLHVWTIGSGSHALSAHVLLDDRKLSEASGVLRAIDTAMRDDFEITHVTVQFECESCEPDTTIICSQASVRTSRESVS
jgi:cobalt-zinc-cadmium efflux system protein